MAVFGKPKERRDSWRLQHEDRSPFLDVPSEVENPPNKPLIGSLIDPRKKAVVLQRIKEGKVPFCAELPKKPPAKKLPLLELAPQLRNGNSYISAWEEAKKRGMRLAPYEIISNPTAMKNILPTVWFSGDTPQFWCREWLVCPYKHGMLEPGKDLVHEREYSNAGPIRTILPASLIPKEALNRKDVMLSVDPTDLEIKYTNSRSHKIPGITIVLHADPSSVIPIQFMIGERLIEIKNYPYIKDWHDILSPDKYPPYRIQPIVFKHDRIMYGLSHMFLSSPDSTSSSFAINACFVP